MSIEPDEYVVAAQTARAEAEAQRILQAALAQAATLQAEMSKEVEAQTRLRLSEAEREIAERLATAEQEAEERVRLSVDTASAVLLNARREADRIREQRAAAVPANGVAAPSTPTPPPTPATVPAESAEVDALLDEAQQAALARAAEADAFAEQRIAETAEWCRQHVADADQIGTQRLLEAEERARKIIEQAQAAASTLRAGTVDADLLDDRAGADDRAPPPPPPPPPPIVLDDGGAEGDDTGIESRPRPSRLAKTTGVLLLLVVAVIGTGLVRSCVAEPYTVASTSMEPAFQDGDRLVVNKLAYRWGDVGRGDIVVFDTSDLSPETHELGSSLVKRVIGLPGEVVEGIGGRVMIDGNQIDEPWLGEVQTPPFGPVQVPKDSLFVLGDARGVSVDSRTFGTVPIDAVVGQVEAVVWPPQNAGGV